jgi:Family of unknown function (DUF6325)
MATVPIGPVDLLVVKFPGNKFKGEIAPALRDLVDSGTIRVIDLLFAIKDAEGNFDMIDVKEVEDAELTVYEPLLTGGTELLSMDDIQQVADMLPNNSSAAVLLFENTWATRFRDALVNADAELIYNIRIPYTVIQELMEEQETAGQETAETTA